MVKQVSGWICVVLGLIVSFLSNIFRACFGSCPDYFTLAFLVTLIIGVILLILGIFIIIKSFTQKR